MIAPGSVSAAFALDERALDGLKREAKTDPQAALKSAARQFEAIFLNAMLKSMRAATPQHGLLDSEQTRQYTALLDEQLAQTLSRRGIGFGELLLKQFGAPARGAAGPAGARAAAPAGSAAPAPAPAAGADEFLTRMRAPAQAASRSTGIPARFLLGQAALESGWGKHEIRTADGTPSHNVFGIKAGKGWHGRTVEAMTTEYVNGVAHRVAQKFRAYGSYAEAFEDYARLLKDSPRYAPVLAQAGHAAGFAAGLQRAGYATDPRYAEKLTQIIEGARMRRATLA